MQKKPKITCINKYTGRRRYYPRRETTLYYIKFAPKGRAPIFKIGITTRPIEQRFSGDNIPYVVLFTKKFKGGLMAYQNEQRILLEYAEYALPYERILKSGNSELFAVDIRQYSNKGAL